MVAHLRKSRKMHGHRKRGRMFSRGLGSTKPFRLVDWQATVVSESIVSILVVAEMLAVSTTTESTSTSEPEWRRCRVGCLECDMSDAPWRPCHVCFRYHPGYFGKAMSFFWVAAKIATIEGIHSKWINGSVFSSYFETGSQFLLPAFEWMAAGRYAQLSLDQARQGLPHHQCGAIVACSSYSILDAASYWELRT